MALKIEMTADVESRSGTKDGRNWNSNKQVGYVTLPSLRYPARFLLELDRDQVPYAPGQYEIDDTSFFVGQYDKLTIGRLKLRQSISPVSKAV